MIRLASISKETGCDVWGKAEYENPGGSPKDRVVFRAVCDAIAAGKVRAGCTLVEGTSGSTGISLALLARALGMPCEVFVQDDASKDKQEELRKAGAIVVPVRAASIVSPDHYVNMARRRGTEEGCFFVDQFETASNCRCHAEGTGSELLRWRPHIDAFVMGAGTGGMLAGVSRALKRYASALGTPAAEPPVKTESTEPGAALAPAHAELRARLRASEGPAVVLADPPGSALFHRVAHGTAFAEEQAERSVRRHRYDTVVEGIGSDRVTGNMRVAVVDAAVRVSDVEAVRMARRLREEESDGTTAGSKPLWLGSSSAVHAEAARQVALALGPGHTVVTVLCDRGERHSTRFWCDAFLRDAGLA